MPSVTVANETRSPCKGRFYRLYSLFLWHSHGPHNDDGYSRRGNFADSLVHNMLFIFSTDGTNINGSRTTEFQDSWSHASLYGAETSTIVFYRGTSYSLVQTLLLSDVSFSYNAQRSDGRTDRRHYDANSLS